ncbi:MAG: hypothetical protein JKX69_00175 [Rhodobacteraceae bacterium]|nr:hypothetical protein [Paracoccaceae bacterium]
MSNSDGFVEEVSEELRKDQMAHYMRRYGWIAVLAVLLLVGGAAWREWRAVNIQEMAQLRGDLLLSAMEHAEPEARIAALDAVADADTAILLPALLASSEELAMGDNEAAAARLDTLAANQDIDSIYREMAQLKALIIRAEILPEDELRSGLEALAAAGAPFRLLAQEQIAYSYLRAGDTAAVLAQLATILEDAELQGGLRERATNLTVALGGELAE